VPDVRAALEFAREHSLPFAVRGGGHCYAGFTSSVAELVIDVGGMRGITVDTEAGTVRVQAGARSGSVAAALANTGAMIPLGRCPTVGMSGLTLGGGWSLYAREHGMACDKVRELTVVTATGDVLKCDERTNSDL